MVIPTDNHQSNQHNNDSVYTGTLHDLPKEAMAMPLMQLVLSMIDHP
jgi:hypothetical protein